MRKRKLFKLPIPIVIAAAIILLGGGALIYALTKSTEKAGPVGYWSFDEGAGSTAYDSSGNSNNGTLTNFDFNQTSNWTTGKVAGALKFDGTNDYVQATVSQATTTVAFWLQSTGGSWQHIANSNGTYYINGVFTAAAPSPYPIYFSGNTVQISKTGAAAYFNGLIDDVRIYNYARTADEVMADYNAGMGTYFK